MPHSDARRTCIAHSSFARLHLLLQCGEVALVNQMIVQVDTSIHTGCILSLLTNPVRNTATSLIRMCQGEGFMKAAISLIPTIPAKMGRSHTECSLSCSDGVDVC